LRKKLAYSGHEIQRALADLNSKPGLEKRFRTFIVRFEKLFRLCVRMLMICSSIRTALR
jgi:hypothetical protein